MLSDKFDIKGLFGVFGVGSLLILGIFFILNGTIEIWETIEAAAELKGWAIMVSIPLIVVGYVFGIIAIEFADLFFSREKQHQKEQEIVSILTKKDSSFLQGLYVENQQTQRLLKGGGVAFIFVAAGCFFESQHWVGIDLLGIIGAIGAALLSILCFVFSNRTCNRFYSMIKHIDLN